MNEIQLTPSNQHESASHNNQTPPPSNKNVTFAKAFSILVILILIIVIISSIGDSSAYLTYDNYLKIRNGMTYNEVVTVLDNHQGELSSSTGYGNYTLSYYTWSNDSGSRCIVVGFENGEVCTKTQYGLK